MSEDFNSIWFTIQKFTNRLSTCTLVQVKSFTPNSSGGLLAGTVSVQPLVNGLDINGNAVPHGALYSLPYFRLQAGKSAIVADPVAGDIGMAAFAHSDISSVKANAAQANPGSNRRFDMSDGMYFGGMSLNGAPTEFIQLTNGGGITITSPGTVTINAPNIVLNGNVASTGTLTNNSKDVGSTHEHGGVASGSSNTGVPV